MNRPFLDEMYDYEGKYRFYGLDVTIIKMREKYLGHYCAYVRIPKGHPLYGKRWEEYTLKYAHGEITYADFGLPRDPNGEQSGEWWIGVDYAHVGDDCVDYETVREDTFHLAREVCEMWKGGKQ